MIQLFIVNGRVYRDEALTDCIDESLAKDVRYYGDINADAFYVTIFADGDEGRDASIKALKGIASIRVES